MVNLPQEPPPLAERCAVRLALLLDDLDAPKKFLPTIRFAQGILTRVDQLRASHDLSAHRCEGFAALVSALRGTVLLSESDAKELPSSQSPGGSTPLRDFCELIEKIGADAYSKVLDAVRKEHEDNLRAQCARRDLYHADLRAGFDRDLKRLHEIFPVLDTATKSAQCFLVTHSLPPSLSQQLRDPKNPRHNDFVAWMATAGTPLREVISLEAEWERVNERIDAARSILNEESVAPGVEATEQLIAARVSQLIRKPEPSLSPEILVCDPGVLTRSREFFGSVKAAFLGDDPDPLILVVEERDPERCVSALSLIDTILEDIHSRVIEACTNYPRLSVAEP